MAPKITTLQTSPAQISNQEFLTEVFGPKVWGRSHVCAFPEDPTQLDKLGKRHYWAGGEARVLVPGMADTDNTFFTISTFNPDPVSGKSRRRKVMFEKSYVITIDDVGLRGLDGTSAKVPAEKIMLDPSYALETSPGNWQVGYLLKNLGHNGDDRGGKVAGLLEAMVAQGLVSDGSDPGMKGVTRYIRLPVGTNTKAKYGTGGFKHVLGTWKPELRYTLEQIADAYKVRDAFDTYDPTLGASNAGTFDPADDAIAKALIAAGQVLSEDTVKKLWHVTCPFVDEHTNKADSGTAYLGAGRWTCFHGHCEHKDHSEFNDKVKEDHPKEWWEATFATKGDGGPESIAPSVATKADNEKKKAETTDFDALFGTGASQVYAKTKLPNNMFSLADVQRLGPNLNIPWLVSEVMPPQGLGVIYGKPGSGKSFVAIDMACRIGLERDWQGNPYRGKTAPNVVYVMSEGGPLTAMNRFAGWLQHNGVNGASHTNIIVYNGSLQMGRGHDEARIKKFVDWTKSIGGVDLLIIDTLARNMGGDENTASDMGEVIKDVDMIRSSMAGFVLMVHHSGKDASKGARGSNSLLGALDLEVECTRAEGPVTGVPGNIGITKTRDGSAMGSDYGYQLVSVHLGVSLVGDAITTLALDTVAAPGRGAGQRPTRSKSSHLAQVYDDHGGEWMNVEDLIKRTSDWSRNGTFGDGEGTNNGAGYPATEYKRELEKYMVEKMGWQLDGDSKDKADYRVKAPNL